MSHSPLFRSQLLVKPFFFLMQTHKVSIWVCKSCCSRSGHLPFELLPCWCVSCGVAGGLQLHSPVKLTHRCVSYPVTQLSRKGTSSLCLFPFLLSKPGWVTWCVYVIVMSTWTWTAPQCNCRVTRRKRGRAYGTGIKRPELVLGIHAKATPSPSSPFLCPSLRLHFAVALPGLSLSHLL